MAVKVTMKTTLLTEQTDNVNAGSVLTTAGNDYNVPDARGAYIVATNDGEYNMNVPNITVSPALSSNVANVGDILSCSTGTITGDEPININYQWVSDGVEVEGEDTNTYMVRDDDAGVNVHCEVIASNPVGSDTDASDVCVVSE